MGSITKTKKKHKHTSSKWFFVTFLSPSWRLLNHLNGHLTIPKKGHQQNCQAHLVSFQEKDSSSLTSFSHHEFHPGSWKGFSDPKIHRAFVKKIPKRFSELTSQKKTCVRHPPKKETGDSAALTFLCPYYLEVTCPTTIPKRVTKKHDPGTLNNQFSMDVW